MIKIISPAKQLCIHKVGNADTDEGLQLSDQVIDLHLSEAQEQALHKFVVGHFTVPEYYAFHFPNDDLSLNPVCRFATQIFQDPDDLLNQSRNMATWLNECSEHPNIKGGDLFVVYFDAIEVEQMRTQAIGIYKIESKDWIFTAESHNSSWSLDWVKGIYPEKLDKGCLIINDNANGGFKVCVHDKLSSAKYWRDDFLKIRPLATSFYLTQNVLTVAKNFVTQQLPEDFEVSKADQIDLLNKSVAYFKTSDRFQEQEFAQSVFQNEEVAERFKQFSRESLEDQDALFHDFDINASAVKKQSKIFKSVLKLDKNFHIYIHGNKELIEKGVDEQGRKFYKIYYTEET
ncbi:MAG TPA: nucleoid-associated protein [Luteibaculaceae bacterium]|nr:nucleoid-associated protein [Luteibaculaceae bacterium]